MEVKGKLGFDEACVCGVWGWGSENKAFKAVILRIDSPGGDALGSDL